MILSIDDALVGNLFMLLIPFFFLGSSGPDWDDGLDSQICPFLGVQVQDDLIGFATVLLLLSRFYVYRQLFARLKACWSSLLGRYSFAYVSEFYQAPS